MFSPFWNKINKQMNCKHLRKRTFLSFCIGLKKNSKHFVWQHFVNKYLNPFLYFRKKFKTNFLKWKQFLLTDCHFKKVTLLVGRFWGFGKMKSIEYSHSAQWKSLIKVDELWKNFCFMKKSVLRNENKFGSVIYFI